MALGTDLNPTILENEQGEAIETQAVGVDQVLVVEDPESIRLLTQIVELLTKRNKAVAPLARKGGL